MLRRPLLLIMPGELTNGQTRSFIELSLTAKRGRTVRFITKEKWKWVSVESPKEYSSSERRREHFGLSKHLLASPVTSALFTFLGFNMHKKTFLAFVVLTAVDSIVISIFVDILVELTNTVSVSEAKSQRTLLIVRRGALSMTGKQIWLIQDELIKHIIRFALQKLKYVHYRTSNK